HTDTFSIYTAPRQARVDTGLATVIYPIQIRAARSLLGMSQDELARRAKLSVITIKRLEAAKTEIRGSAQTAAHVQQALEAAGIVFIHQDREHGPGVRLRKRLS